MKQPLPIPKGNSLFLALLSHGFSVVSNAFSSFRTTALPFMAFALLMVLPLFLQAQFVPEGIHYQATALDAQGQPMANQNTVLRISLGSGSEAISVALYSEEHEVKTDDLGQFSLVIGQGKRIKGALASLPWAEEQTFQPAGCSLCHAREHGYPASSRRRKKSVDLLAYGGEFANLSAYTVPRHPGCAGFCH